MVSHSFCLAILVLLSHQQYAVLGYDTVWKSSPAATSLEGWNMTPPFGLDKLKFVPDPDQAGNTIMQVTFPGDTVNTPGGIGFTAQPINISLAETVTLSYEVKFPVGFQFVKGGKLPGLYGNIYGYGATCGGGSPAMDCFSTRYMWRADGAGELYAYANVPAQDPGFCSAFPPLTVCDPTHGNSLGRGSFSFSPGKWTTLVQTIKLNAAGQNNGTMAIYADGKLVLSSNKMVWRMNSNYGFTGIVFNAFFGGVDKSFSNPVEQSVYFRNFMLAVGSLSTDAVGGTASVASATKVNTLTAAVGGTASVESPITPSSPSSTKVDSTMSNFAYRVSFGLLEVALVCAIGTAMRFV